MAIADPNETRARMRDTWEHAAGPWGRRADRIREWGLPVSEAMVTALDLKPGARVLELACGPGDTGFMAASVISPGGTLISSDGAEAMVEVARSRAAAAGLGNVEHRQLELEWIDLPAADVDAVLCRWGIMLIVDPAAAAREIRRVLRPGGRAALAVWDLAQRNPWATIPNGAMVKLGHAERPDPDAPGMFALAAPGRIEALLEDAGFTDVEVRSVELSRRYGSVREYLEETIEVSPTFSVAWIELDDGQREEVSGLIAAGIEPYTAADGSVALPGSSLVATATG